MRFKPEIDIIGVDPRACNLSKNAKAIAEVEGRLSILIDHKC